MVSAKKKLYFSEVVRGNVDFSACTIALRSRGLVVSCSQCSVLTAVSSYYYRTSTMMQFQLFTSSLEAMLSCSVNYSKTVTVTGYRSLFAATGTVVLHQVQYDCSSYCSLVAKCYRKITVSPRSTVVIRSCTQQNIHSASAGGASALSYL